MGYVHLRPRKATELGIPYTKAFNVIRETRNFAYIEHEKNEIKVKKTSVIETDMNISAAYCTIKRYNILGIDGAKKHLRKFSTNRRGTIFTELRNILIMLKEDIK